MYIKFVVPRNANVNGFLRPECPNLMAGRGRLYKWIVRRNCAVRSYAKNFSTKITQILRVTSVGVVSHGNIKVGHRVQSEGRRHLISGCGEGVQLKEGLPYYLVKPHRRWR